MAAPLQGTPAAVNAVIQALVDPAFVEQVHKLLDRHAPAFVGLHVGGELTLGCTEGHSDFKAIYEGKVDTELAAHAASRDDLVAFLEQGSGENEGVYYLLDMLLSLDDFNHFVELMIRRRDGKRVTLPVNLRDAQDITELMFGHDGEEEYYEEEAEQHEQQQEASAGATDGGN
mmetsp:Transcript_47261/g.119616  ORF Transcript_47261/g.119616 Transcript_47261/m.119616 type:complete len:173 (-) Transcript_47261:244-762(-)